MPCGPATAPNDDEPGSFGACVVVAFLLDDTFLLLRLLATASCSLALNDDAVNAFEHANAFGWKA